MRRPVLAAATVFTVVAVALSLHTLSTAMGGDEAQLLRPLFASSIARPSTIAGTVFEDVDGDGEQDAEEAGMADVMVKLDSEAGHGPQPVATDPNGDYSFTLTWADTYTVTAVSPAGYASTTPQSVVVQITGPEQQETVDFGYQTRFTIHLPVVGRNFP